MLMTLSTLFCSNMWPCNAGEYNLRLGISKELHPDLVATYQGSSHLDQSASGTDWQLLNVDMSESGSKVVLAGMAV